MEETILYLAAFVGLVAVAVATSIIAVKRNGRGAGDLIKQLILFAAIAALLPLSSYAGATLLHPRTKLVELTQQRQRAQQETYDTQDPNARRTARDKQEELTKQIEEETRLFNRAMFWIGLSVGLTSMVAGFYLPAVAVGTGLALGGVCTLSAGCYSYWDAMGDWLRFVALLGTLVLLVAIGLTKYARKSDAETRYAA